MQVSWLCLAISVSHRLTCSLHARLRALAFSLIFVVIAQGTQDGKPVNQRVESAFVVTMHVQTPFTRMGCEMSANEYPPIRMIRTSVSNFDASIFMMKSWSGIEVG
jgi:hypothetical protein